jgi:hypothetical protein
MASQLYATSTPCKFFPNLKFDRDSSKWSIQNDEISYFYKFQLK